MHMLLLSGYSMLTYLNVIKLASFKSSLTAEIN